MSNDPHQYEDYYDEQDEERCDICNLPLEECTCDDCGLMPDGTCALAGTEFCDWHCRSKPWPSPIITADDLRAWGCTIIRRNHKLWINTEAGVKDADGNWIGRINEEGVFEPNYSTLNGYKPRLMVRCK